MAQAQVIVVARDRHSLHHTPLRALASAGRHLLAVTDDDLPRLFEDAQPPVMREAT